MTAMRVRKALLISLVGLGLGLGAALTGVARAQSQAVFPGWQATGAPRTIRPAEQSPSSAALPTKRPSPVVQGRPYEPQITPSATETASRTTTPLRRNQVRTGQIAAIDGASASLVSGDEALSGDLWGAAEGADITRLLDQVEPHPTSRVLNVLMVRLLQSGGKPPLGSLDDFIRARVNALLRLGRPDDAARLAGAVPGEDRMAVNAALLAGNFDGVCGRDAPTGGPEEFWTQIAIWCSARAGDEASALLDLDLMQEADAADPLFLALMDRQLFGAAVEIPPYTELEPLHLAMLAEQGALPDISGELPSAYIPLLAGAVQDPVDRAVLMVEAWRLGAVSTARVAAALDAVPTALKGPMAKRFAATRAVSAAPGDLADFWQYGARQDRFPLTAALTTQALSDFPPDAATGDIRYGAVQALAANGDLREAYEWFDLPPGLAPTDPVAEAHIEALLVLADPRATLDRAPGLEDDLSRRAANGDQAAGRILKLIRAMETSPGGTRPSAAGEAVLRNHLALQGAALSQVSGAQLSSATMTLRAAALDDQARALAIEAALTPPILAGG